jgi:hypothetical protein
MKFCVYYVYWLAIITASCLLKHHSVQGAVPTAMIELYRYTETKSFQRIVASTAMFGKPLPFGKPKDSIPIELKLTPENDEFLCNEANGLETYTASDILSDSDFALVVPRGKCSFERKVLSAQRLGATFAIIVDNLASKYGLRTNNSNNSSSLSSSFADIVWPTDIYDYNCRTQLYAHIPMHLLYFDQVPYDTKNDELLSDGVAASNEANNLCRIWSLGEASKNKCDSGRCLLTGEMTYSIYHKDTLVEACCANDFFFEMGGDTDLPENYIVDIPSGFLNMKEGDNLLQAITDNSPLYVNVYERSYPKVNISSVFIFILGVATTWFASWFGAKEYRNTRKLLSNTPIAFESSESPPPPIQELEVIPDGNQLDLNDDSARSNDTGVPSTQQVSSTPSSEMNTNAERPSSLEESPMLSMETERHTFVNEDQDDTHHPTSSHTLVSISRDHQAQHQPIHMELKMSQAVLFLVFACIMLFVLYFTRLYEIVTVIYSIGATSVVVRFIIHPIFSRIFRWMGISEFMNKPRNSSVNFVELLSICMGISIGIIWLRIAFSGNNPAYNTFYWLYQDIMGACVCIGFLKLVRLNSIMVATIFLVAAFVYDIFFVFLTPYIFGESVMETVASGGRGGDAELCAIDPTAYKCSSVPLPMLFSFPRLNDYRGGFSMLGLGDIVLPGLLTAFAARLDAAKSLVLTYNQRRRAARRGEDVVSNISRKERLIHRLRSGYFFTVIIAYAVGLFFANMAVYLMKRGQPALLYIVPTTLISLLLKGYKKKELALLWNGHKSIHKADAIRQAVALLGPNRVGTFPLRNGTDVSIAETGSASLSEDDLSLSREQMDGPERILRGDVA